jgi:hypothetical protein
VPSVNPTADASQRLAPLGAITMANPVKSKFLSSYVAELGL